MHDDWGVWRLGVHSYKTWGLSRSGGDTLDMCMMYNTKASVVVSMSIVVHSECLMARPDAHQEYQCSIRTRMV